MKLKDFDYQIPEELIVQRPLKRRDQAKLMIIDRKKKTITHDVFANIGNYLPDSSCLVVNDSKVVPARLLGKKQRNGAKVEIFLLKALQDGYSYEVLMKPMKKVRAQEDIIFDGCPLVAQLVDRDNRIVRFNRKNVNRYLNDIGHIPLPPYIKRRAEKEDHQYYQTVYAKKMGSVASPTAGLHFTTPLINKLKRSGQSFEKVTLHINYGTFKPVEENDITKHKMHTEKYELASQAWKNIQKAKDEDRKVVAIGTTSCRVLETVAQNKRLKGSTDIFIYPGYKFKMVDALVTNFHLPLSTLLMLVYAFGSKPLMQKAYKEAMRLKYRFYSYGDAMMII